MTSATTIGSIQILGAAFFSTRHASAEDVLAGRERSFTPPAYRLLVGRARRFTSLVTQMHLEVCGVLSPDTADPPMAVFATRHGEIRTAEQLITDFRDSSMVSSARFAQSVHNTASGVYSVATGSRAATTTVTGANAIAAGWLEAALTVLQTERTVLLSIADEPVPAVFCGPAEPAGVAAAFLLGSALCPGRRAQLAITPCLDDPEVSPLQVLARGADAAMRPQAASVVLGRIQPGAVLELCFPSQEARA
jgi:beta-ketoacyl synthase-like protein